MCEVLKLCGALGPILRSVCAYLLAAMPPTGPVRSAGVQPGRPHPLCEQVHSLQDVRWADVQRLLPPGYGADHHKPPQQVSQPERDTAVKPSLLLLWCV